VELLEEVVTAVSGQLPLIEGLQQQLAGARPGAG
jgi:hypothetical protein